MINPNKVITAPANTEKFVRHPQAIRIPKDMQGWILKKVFIHFSPGCKTLTHVKIADRGGYMIPDPRITELDYIFGDNVVFQFNVNMRVREGSEFYIDYRNTDDDPHTFSVEFVFTQPAEKKGVGK